MVRRNPAIIILFPTSVPLTLIVIVAVLPTAAQSQHVEFRGLQTPVPGHVPMH